MIDQAYSILLDTPPNVLAVATLSLVAALPLSEDPAEFGFMRCGDDEYEKQVWGRLTSSFYTQPNTPHGRHLGSFCYLRKAILL